MIATWIAAGGLAIGLGGIGIRLIMKATRLIDAVETLDTTIKEAIADHERRLHLTHHGHRRTG